MKKLFIALVFLGAASKNLQAEPPYIKNVRSKVHNRVHNDQGSQERLHRAKEMIHHDLEHQHTLYRNQRRNIVKVLGSRFQCPRGSYKETCGLCSCTDTELTCYCLTDKGTLRKSTQRSNLQKGERVANENGILTRVKHDDQRHRGHKNNGDAFHTSNHQKLSIAAMMGNVRKVKKLIKKGVNVNFQNKEIEAPLINAAMNGKLDIINILLNTKGIHVNIRSNGGMTPLMYAASNGFPNIVKALLKKGANIDLTSTHSYWVHIKAGSTALDFAMISLKASPKDKKRKQVVDLLESTMKNKSYDSQKRPVRQHNSRVTYEKYAA